MRTVLVLISLFTTLALQPLAFGVTKQSQKERRVYISPNDVVCSEKGILIKHGTRFRSVKSLASDEHGIYVLKGWWPFGKSDNKEDEPRGAHKKHKRKSTKDKHQEANARRQKEQRAAQARAQEAKRRGRR